MLTHLSIRHLAVVKHLDVDFRDGMTAITGETGAGKSISIDALSLCLGGRADAGMVRKGEAKADVNATFDVAKLAAAKSWLVEHDLEDEDTCLMRRVVSSEGRSKGYINGTPVSAQQMRQLGMLLVSIHGQHAHHQLLNPDNQRSLLDDYANHPDLLARTLDAHRSLREVESRLASLKSDARQRADRLQLLQYQVEELDDFGLAENEFAELEVEHKKLSHSQTLLEQAQLSFHQLYEADDFNALSAVQMSLDRLSELQEHDPELSPIAAMLNEALINIDEASQALRHYTEQLEIDPLRMQQVEARYTQALEFARKHSVSPEHLYTTHQSLSAELAALRQDASDLTDLEELVQAQHHAYQEVASQLTQSRQSQAVELAREVRQHIVEMNMPHAQIEVSVTPDPTAKPSSNGVDEVQIRVSTNPGQPMDVLDKVVSGGELSRIGLALQVISSQQQAIPTLIFDEVDTGISGPTASVIGQLLRRLGEQGQVMCVTHLPQVAACGHQQMFVTKFTDGDTTETHMNLLEDDDRVEALARLLAGDTLTPSAIANARELLNLQ